MKRSLKTLFLFFLLAVVPFSKGYAQKSEPPNIVLFLVDDMGWQDTSVPFWTKITAFNKRYQTPHMERLANEGLKFTQAYAASVCSPSRVSLMTGMNAARHRVTNWTLRKDLIQPMEKNSKTLSFPIWNMNGLNPKSGIPHTVYAKPLPQLLKDAGYYTIHCGKAHFGAIGTLGANPINLGFDVNIAGHAAGGPGSYYGTENFGNNKDTENVWGVPGLEKYYGKDIFLTEALTEEALHALDKSQEAKKPFFLYMSHYAVHVPLYGDKRFLKKYIDAGLDPKEAKYASMIEGMDKSLGDIMDYLQKNNLTENTVILFMSDNGGLSVHGRGGVPNTHNKPLNSGKGSAYEGGIREPMIVKWPNVTRAGSSTDAKVIIEDFFPTILELANITKHTPQIIDGKSFTNVLKGKKGNTRPLFWHYPNEWGPSGPGIGASSTVRKGDWKLIYYHIDSRFELFNIKDDIGELNNVASKYPKKVKQLSRTLGRYLRSVDAQMPARKDTGKQVPWPDEVAAL